MKWRRFLAIIGISFLIVLGAAISGQVHYEQSILEVATAPDFCPYEFWETEDGQTTLTGFDIDLARLITEDLGYNPKFQTMHFNSLLPMLRSQEADFAISAITPTTERRDVVAFSSVYYEAQSAIVTPKGDTPNSLAELGRQRIGVKLGTIHEQLAATVPDSEIIPFDHMDDVLQELRTERIDAAIVDRAIADAYMSERRGVEMLVLENEQPAGVAIAFPKDSRLLPKVNQILRRMSNDGTIDELILKWFDAYVCPAPEG